MAITINQNIAQCCKITLKAQAQHFLKKAQKETDDEDRAFFFIEFAARATLATLFDTLKKTKDGHLEWPESIAIEQVRSAARDVINPIADRLSIQTDENSVGSRADEILLGMTTPDPCDGAEEHEGEWRK